MKHSRDTSGFSSDSFASKPPLPCTSCALLGGTRRGDVLGADKLRHCGPLARCFAAGDTDLLPDLSPRSLLLWPVSLADMVRPSALLNIPPSTHLSLLHESSPEKERFFWTFAGERDLGLCSPASTSSPRFFVVVVWTEKFSLTLSFSELSSGALVGP